MIKQYQRYPADTKDRRASALKYGWVSSEGEKVQEKSGDQRNNSLRLFSLQRLSPLP